MTGNPTGGIFYGDSSYVEDSLFYPSRIGGSGPKWYKVYYDLQDANSCTTTIIDSVFVDVCESVDEIAGSIEISI